MDGEGNFNWRFVFPFSYLPHEKKLVLAEKVRLLSAVMFLRPNKFWNKTGTRQCTQAVWSTFAEIHSAQPGALIRYLGYWNFRLEFVMPHISQQTRDLPNLSYDCDLWKDLVFFITFGTLSACRSFEAKDYWTFSHCFHRISFCSRVYVHGIHYLTSRSTWAQRV